MTRRILFVDDEPMVLRGLQSVLRRFRREWDMVFVDGAEQALAEFHRAPFDVVVSDMRMPSIDGAELLRRVAQIAPTTVRLILTGHADDDALGRAKGIAHRCLSKPCELDELHATIESLASSVA